MILVVVLPQVCFHYDVNNLPLLTVIDASLTIGLCLRRVINYRALAGLFILLASLAVDMCVG